MVRSVPGPVSRLTVRISTILGILIWDYKKNDTGGYTLKSFTAEFREHLSGNETGTNKWERLDPINIAPNVVSILSYRSAFIISIKYIYSYIFQRYMEIYHLRPNTTYEFRIWGNNYLGAGEIVSTKVTTLPEIGDVGMWYYSLMSLFFQSTTAILPVLTHKKNDLLPSRTSSVDYERR